MQRLRRTLTSAVTGGTGTQLGDSKKNINGSYSNNNNGNNRNFRNRFSQSHTGVFGSGSSRGLFGSGSENINRDSESARSSASSASSSSVGGSNSMRASGASSSSQQQNHRQLFRFLKKINIYMYNYGSPRVGNNNFAQLYNKHVLCSYRICVDGDIVPALPPPGKYYHIGTEILIDSVGAGSIIIDPSFVELWLRTHMKSSVAVHSLLVYRRGLLG